MIDSVEIGADIGFKDLHNFATDEMTSQAS
jgi:lactam utilization protein B